MVFFFFFIFLGSGLFVDEPKTVLETNCSTNDCEDRNEGRSLIRDKVAAISSHYEKVTGINLESLRNIVQSRL